ncbi:hypothetical protein O3P69_005183 [Scylla paramamosain]|uniref:Uncharacterized protein n=1 Tax=Scylla paramamosain TaxID=85552 RepID=A0AAW0UAA3_SCYPA
MSHAPQRTTHDVQKNEMPLSRKVTNTSCFLPRPLHSDPTPALSYSTSTPNHLLTLASFPRPLCVPLTLSQPLPPVPFLPSRAPEHYPSHGPSAVSIFIRLAQGGVRRHPCVRERTEVSKGQESEAKRWKKDSDNCALLTVFKPSRLRLSTKRLHLHLYTPGVSVNVSSSQDTASQCSESPYFWAFVRRNVETQRRRNPKTTTPLKAPPREGRLTNYTP